MNKEKSFDRSINESGHRIWLLSMDLLETYNMILTRYLEYLDDIRRTKKLY